MKYFFITTFIFLSFFLTAFGQTKNRSYKNFRDTSFKVGDIIIGPEIWFSVSGGAYLMPQSKDSLKIVAEFIKKYPSFKIEISAHTDSRGKKEMNLLISEHRAKRVFEYLTKELLLPANNIESKGYGSSNLLISDDVIKKATTNYEKEKLHQKNRRIEIKILNM